MQRLAYTAPATLSNTCCCIVDKEALLQEQEGPMDGRDGELR